MIGRYASALIAAIAITFSLFWVMQFLIIGQQLTLNDGPNVKLLDFVRLKQTPETQLKERKPPDRPPPPETPPEPPKMQAQSNANPNGPSVNIPVSSLNTGLDIAGPGAIAMADTEAIPLFRMQPEYPDRAASRGIEGYVIMEFTVTETGSVTNIKVVEANPPGIFDRAATRAMERWKYKPKIVDGKPVPRHGVRNQLTFKLDQ